MDTDGTVFRFAPAELSTGPRLSRKAWRRVGFGGAALVIAVAAFVVFGPEAPSPGGTVRDYFDDLAKGDTAAALALVDTGGELDDAPLLVPEALAAEANRPGDLSVTSEEPYAAESYSGSDEYTVVTTRYTLGGQTVEQRFTVHETEDGDVPYLLEQPFLYLTVALPGGMDVAVNGITVDSATAARGTPVFPAVYAATTSGNVLFAGATRAAAYEFSGQAGRADIDLSQPEIAAGAQGAVQTAVETYLDTNCVNPAAYSYGCPLRAPSSWWSQTTTWAITAYPQIGLEQAEAGATRLQFATGTSGSADYTTTYTEFGGVAKKETGTVPVDITGSAALGDDGAVQIALGY
ncbi:hypothetical protein [Actinoplanes sp. NPDC051851]|uniref:hypothetical protein n=1 Tax=Actinoplanes sp. NPDC051851 TaxID=3154753 RepID=UPI00342ECFF8